jgi:hypothetical protein
MRRTSILIALLLALFTTNAQVQWPKVTETTKPWTRWWWEGSAVNKADLTLTLEQFKNAGLGGVEITPIYGVKGSEQQEIKFLSSKWMQMLVHTLDESKRLGLGVDMANATGWPFGGPWVTDNDASKSIYFSTYTVNGGEQLLQPVEYKREALIRTANNQNVSIDTLLNPVSKNKNLQALALDQIQYPGKLPLETLMAYSDNKSSIDLTNFVDANGKLSWTAPAGKWTLYALFQGLHGKMVERAAPGGEGYAIDHFSSTAANNYFSYFDQAFKGYNLTNLRGFFNDSYEVDDARGQANWTSNLFAEFKNRKGYDLKNHLPELLGKGELQEKARVIYDYRAVIDELILENFTQKWKQWGQSKGKIVRNQSHGSPANTLDLYSVVDIPETEGSDILRFKFASSAANVTGKPLVSSESATWLNDHFLSSWGDVKKAIDLYFLGGVNHIFYHGTAYSPQQAPWPGWLFYAAVHFQPVNPQWKDFHALNAYITRVQSFLQQGKPANDVLMYYPIADRYAEPGNTLLQHFDGMGKNFENTNFEFASTWMLENGYSFDFFSDRQLNQFRFENNAVVTGGNTYQTIFLPANKLISEQSMAQLLLLAKQGAKILVYKNLPQDVPGLGELAKRQEKFKQLLANLNFKTEGLLKKATIGKGMVIVSDDLNALMESAGIQQNTFVKNGLSSIKRKMTDGSVHFLTNSQNKTFNGWVSVNEAAKSFVLFNPMTGKSGTANTRRNEKGNVEIQIQLQPFETIILQNSKNEYKSNPYQYINPIAEPLALSGTWTITFLNGGPAIPKAIQTSQLSSWTNVDGDDYKNFSGTANYSISFEKPAGNATSWLLDLGKVNETAEVKINGKTIATLVGPNFQCVIPTELLQKNNTLDIVVANLMANRIAYMDRNKIPWKIFYNTNMPAKLRENTVNGLFSAAAWKPMASGIIGPVTLTALK